MAKAGRPSKNSLEETLEGLKPWAGYGISRSSWYHARASLRGQQMEDHLKMMQLKKMLKRSREDSIVLETEIEKIKVSFSIK